MIVREEVETKKDEREDGTSGGVLWLKDGLARVMGREKQRRCADVCVGG
jgi:hypothetical protein